MLKVIPFAHQLIEEIVQPGDTVIDATCGNGHDTLFLSNLITASGQVYACDVQAQAIETTKQLLTSHEKKNITYIEDSHANLDKYLPTATLEKTAAAIFNLGYLPKSDKQVITDPDSTITAVEKLFPYLKKGGRIVIVVYHGHEGGELEKERVLRFVQNLDQSIYEVLQYQFINQRNTPPFVIAIEKR